ncbi:MMPL family transporter [Allorhizocola rhizosphaerae]|uniref:MMPL family transporter n=1 Tax=Allorhizocola rhizosphaerae TaxID=1872709 RepID=UPI000E3B71EE|nr:MMPL family transporter [Allorhizocola rhizosphaerae]
MRVVKWPAVGAWLLIAIVASMFAGRVGDVETNDLRNWLPATAQSTRALDLMPPSDESLLVVYARQAGVTAEDRAAVAADAAALRGEGPIPAEDGRALLLIVPLTQAQVQEDAIAGVLGTVRAEVDSGRPSGLDARLTGGPAASADFDGAFDALDETLLIVTVSVVALLLLLTYRSPVLLLLPLIAVGAASQLANALVYLCAKHLGLVVDGASAGILTVLVFGAGTDYALLLISRYREELKRHEDRHAAIRAALKESLPAIVASAATVILALLTLVFADMNSTRGLGPVAAIGIGCALLAMTTLLPMLLVLVGRWAFWPLIPRFGGTVRESHGLWSRVAGIVARRPGPVWMVTALALVGLTVGVSALSTALGREDAFVSKPESVVGFELLAAHYPAGSSSPVDVFTKEPAAVRSTLEGVPGVARVDEPSPGLHGWTLVPVVLSDDPSGPAARDTVARIRAALPAAVVGGETAQELDKQSTMDRDLRLIIPLILLVVFVVLVVLLRAVVAPVLLLVSVVLSFGAALGASALIFEAIGFAAVDKTVLLMGFLFLVALGVDYTIFLMTRAREEVARMGHARGVPRALEVTGGVITSAGLVLAATFAVLAMMPIVFMMQIGIVVAVGVLLDTFVVRTLLVPGLVLHVGRGSWWPGRLRLQTSADSPPLSEGAGVPPELVRRG